MSDRELMQQALEALEEEAAWLGSTPKGAAAITALRERLAQPDAYGYASRLAVAIWKKHYMKDAPQWKPLDDLMGVLTQIDNMTSGLTRLAQPEQEPVAWMSPGKERLEFARKDTVYGSHTIPLYTTPPRCPNCASLEAQNTELDAKLAEMEQEPVRLQCTTCGTVYADGVPPQVPEQEPVAWRDHVEQRLLTWRQSFVSRSGDQLALDDFMDKESLDDLIDYVCDEYTTPPRREWPVQEPVAQEWRYYFSHSGVTGKPDEVVGPCFTDRKEVAFGVGCFDQTALYTPPRREWQGLTDEDKQIAFDDTQEGGGFWEFADAIEAKLREKNA